MKYLKLIKKYKHYIILIFLILIIIIGYIWANQVTAKQKNNEVLEELNEELKEEKIEVIETKKIKVDIKGEVNKPNVYELDESSRVIDLINKAGGLTKNANTSNINLSKKLKDENVVIIYSNDEIKDFINTQKNTKKDNIESNNEDVNEYDVPVESLPCSSNNSACIDDDDIVVNNPTTDENNNSNSGSSSTNSPSNEETNKIININTATKDELLSLDGIGESKALSIIAYREEFGKFTSIEEIKNVKGIGDTIYEKIKNNITV